MATIHIESNPEDIAKTVLMPGDPLRAKFIAQNFLENPRLVNDVRGMYAFTGEYKGKKVTVMASGIGMPSMGIYSYELYNGYNVENIIRIGTCGAYTRDLNLYDVVLATKTYSETTYDDVMSGQNTNIIESSNELNQKIIESANQLNHKLIQGSIHTTDVFYQETEDYEQINKQFGCIAGEMEAFALFHNAKRLNKKAACLLTVSDSMVTKEHTSQEEREKKLIDMIKIALESI